MSEMIDLDIVRTEIDMFDRPSVARSKAMI